VSSTGRTKELWRTVAVLCGFGVVLLGVGAATASSAVAAGAAGAGSHAGLAQPTPPLSRSGIAHWREIGTYTEPTLYAGEGLATVELPGGGSEIVYRGLLSVPPSLAAEGWTHIGDPDSADGDIIDAYQGPASGSSKLFVVTTPGGTMIPYLHHLRPHELYNNSFDAISPNGQWMVAGTWGTINHLQVYPTPLLNKRTPPAGGNLPLAAFIALDHPVNDIQGCDFITATTLICASDDDSRHLFANEKPLLEVRLAHPLVGKPVAGHVIDLGPIPQVSACTGTFEAEGVDYDVMTGILRVEIIQPGSCILSTTVIEYQHRH
jgi:hypothetical protein